MSSIMSAQHNVALRSVPNSSESDGGTDAGELMITIYWLIDSGGSFMGILTNALLILTTFKTSGKRMASYSYLFLFTGFFDMLFSIVEFMTQHQLLVRHGVMFVMPHGIEHFFVSQGNMPDWAYWVFMVPHGFVTMHGFFILGAQYKYRNDLVTKGDGATIWDLMKVLAFTGGCGLFTGISLAVAVYESKQRGIEYYQKQINGPWFNKNGLKYFMYAADIQDYGTMGFFYGGLFFSVMWLGVCGYYTHKTWKFMQGSGASASDRTKSLQAQYTKSLIIQTVNACVFVVVPILMICVAMLFRLDAEFIGMGTMAPLSWLPSANAVLTMYVVKAYRAYIKSLFGCGGRFFKGGEHSSTGHHRQTNKVSAADKGSSPGTDLSMIA